MSEPSIFGHIPGNPVGTPYDRRRDLKAAGLHRHLMNGISGHYDEGADAICLSGGYKDDRDEGDWILYTGEGGQDDSRTQIRDQVMKQGNQALVYSEERGLPIRVIRGRRGDPRWSPKSGFRYDGLYTVTRHSTQESTDGPLVFQFELQAVPAEDDAGWTATPAHPGVPSPAPPAGNLQPGRERGVVVRTVRNSAVSQWVKDLYDHTCQFCGVRLEVAGVGYAEGAHIKPLGPPHIGSDTVENVLCLCPNDHVLFDRGGVYVRDGVVHRTESHTRLSHLQIKAGHSPADEFFVYHRQAIAGVR